MNAEMWNYAVGMSCLDNDYRTDNSHGRKETNRRKEGQKVYKKEKSENEAKMKILFEILT